MKSAWRDTTALITKDGSTIRELMHPAIHGNRLQSLAEATVLPDASTQLHRHQTTEEIYHFTAGTGRMRLGDEEFAVTAGETASAPSLARGPRLDPIGDTVCIPPGTAHRLHNTGQEPLRLLCSCSPPYSDADTELL